MTTYRYPQIFASVLQNNSDLNTPEQKLTDERCAIVREAFRKEFKGEPDLIAIVPGRANIIGEHVDYPPFMIYVNPEDRNRVLVPHNYSLPFAVQYNIIVAARPREDSKIVAYSINYANRFEFDLSELDSAESQRGSLSWANYLLGAYQAARQKGWNYRGAEFVIEGNVPLAAGMSSSAALCVALSFAFSEMFGWNKHTSKPGKVELALFARAAEHSPLIGSQCGYLDQLASIFGEQGCATLIDYGMVAIIVDKLSKGQPITEEDVDRLIQIVSLRSILEKGYELLLVNSMVKRPEGGLASTAYNIRVKELIEAGRIISHLLGSAWAPHISCYTQEQFETVSSQLEETSLILLRRTRHVLTERERTLRTVEAVREGNVDTFARILNECGESLSMAGDFEISALIDLRTGEIIDDTLDVLVKVARAQGASGRMMGGGGGGCALLLVKKEIDLSQWREQIIQQVKEGSVTGRIVKFIGEAIPSEGAKVIPNELFRQKLREELGGLVRDSNNFIRNRQRIEELTLKILGISDINEFKPLRPIRAITTAAGVSSRMGGRNKVLCEVGGKPIIEGVLDILNLFDNKPIVVVRPENWRDALGIAHTGGTYKEVKETLDREGYSAEYCYQDYIKGDGFAVLRAMEELRDFNGDVLIIWADKAVLRPETVLWLVAIHQALGDVSLTIASVLHEHPYTPLFTDKEGYVIGGKKGAETGFGLDDIGVFVGRAQDVLKALEFSSQKAKSVKELLHLVFSDLVWAQIQPFVVKPFVEFFNRDFQIPFVEFMRIKREHPDWDPSKVEVYLNPFDNSVNRKGELNFIQIVSLLYKAGHLSIAVPLADEREWKGVDTPGELEEALLLKQKLGIE